MRVIIEGRKDEEMEFGVTSDVDFDTETDKLCLSFANTADWHASAQPVEGLKRYWDLLNWAFTTGVISREKANRLALIADQSPDVAEGVLRDGVELREAIYRIFSAIANQRSVDQGDIRVLNRFMQTSYPFLQIVDLDDGFQLSWGQSIEALDQILWPVIHSAVKLLTSDQLERIGQCADDRGCGWLFYDTSRNRSRRWCSMESCGNRAKAQRYYEKERMTR
jgi:predicted RNA-binding Zn ribbon-like protein